VKENVGKHCRRENAEEGVLQEEGEEKKTQSSYTLVNIMGKGGGISRRLHNLGNQGGGGGGKLCKGVGGLWGKESGFGEGTRGYEKNTV